MIKPEDRAMAHVVAAQIYCARIQASGQGSFVPNKVDVAGEAVSLLQTVDKHLPPSARKAE